MSSRSNYHPWLADHQQRLYGFRATLLACMNKDNLNVSRGILTGVKAILKVRNRKDNSRNHIYDERHYEQAL
jgi:hypothetical protein